MLAHRMGLQPNVQSGPLRGGGVCVLVFSHSQSFTFVVREERECLSRKSTLDVVGLEPKTVRSSGSQILA